MGEQFSHGFAGPVVAACLDMDNGAETVPAAQRRLEVAKGNVQHAGLEQHPAHAQHGLAQVAVGDVQRLVEADVCALHDDDVLVGKVKYRIGNLFKVAHSSGGLVAAPDALAFKRCRRHAHDQSPGFLGQVRQKRSGPRAGAAPHPGDDKD